MRTPIVAAALSAAVLIAPAFAFRDTSPLLLWASDPSHAFAEAARALSGSALTPADEVYSKISTLGCEWETVVVVHVDDLHQSCLPSLNFPHRDAHLHLPYLSKPDRQSLQSKIDEWADHCGAMVVDSFETQSEGSKNVIKLDMTQDEPVPTIPSDLPSPHIMIVTGSQRDRKVKRQEDEYPFPTYTTETATTTATATATATTTARRNSTIPTDGPLLERVQILTAPIITALLVSFGLFIPIAAFGINALTGIQVPPRMMEIGKGLVVDKGRKDQ